MHMQDRKGRTAQTCRNKNAIFFVKMGTLLCRYRKKFWQANKYALETKETLSQTIPWIRIFA